MLRNRGICASASTPKACAAGQPSPPITEGAWNQASRSTRSARSSAAAICAPPSVSNRVMPRSASTRSPAARSIPAGESPTCTTTTPADSSADTRRESTPPRHSTQVGAERAVATRREVSGRRKWLSATTRTIGSGLKPGMRQVRSGLSASTVPTPTMMASCRPRSAWAIRRAGSPVIHWLSPVRVAMRPSSVEASFNVPSGRPR